MRALWLILRLDDLRVVQRRHPPVLWLRRRRGVGGALRNAAAYAVQVAGTAPAYAAPNALNAAVNAVVNAAINAAVNIAVGAAIDAVNTINATERAWQAERLLFWIGATP